MANMLDMPDTTSYYSKSDIARNRLMAALSYLSVLVLIPVFAAKDSPYARFHAAQGVNLLILSVLWAIVAAIIGAIFGAIGVGVLSVLWGIVFWVITIALALLMVIGILGALQGRARELPLIGGFRILK
ncbi:MAG: zinc ribbon domain-containing protein [Candidatus Spyradocola sp.]